MTDRNCEIVDVMGSGAISGAGTIDIGDVGAYGEINIYFDVTAKSGSPLTLDFTVEDSPDDEEFYTLDTITQITTEGNYTKRIAANIGKFLRLSYTCGGTSEWTLEIKAAVKS